MRKPVAKGQKLKAKNLSGLEPLAFSFQPSGVTYA
ncbi:MAG: hypothetical protein KatS3mg072_1414 [Meiothermus sp.]|nr:MAG: hypothetical protein KatS3mg072_1414 [Meiothermus sp.]